MSDKAVQADKKPAEAEVEVELEDCPKEILSQRVVDPSQGCLPHGRQNLSGLPTLLGSGSFIFFCSHLPLAFFTRTLQ